jgi:hypothetical protein
MWRSPRNQRAATHHLLNGRAADLDCRVLVES